MANSQSWLSVLGPTIFYLICIICITLSINGNYKLLKVSKTIFIEKRSPFILFGLNASFIIQMLSMIPGFVSRVHMFGHPSSAMSIVVLSLTAICLYVFLFFSITKNWMIFYKERWTFYTLQSEWQRHISSKDACNNWFISNNYRYGSLSYMYKLFGSYHVSIAIFVVIMLLCSYSGVIAMQYAAILLTFPFIFTVIIYIVIICKTHRISLIDDIFFIHWEAKRHTQILCVYIVIFISNQLLIPVINDTVLETCIFAPMYCVVVYALHHVSTYGIYDKNVVYLQRNHSSSTISIGSKSANSTTKLTPSPSKESPKKLSLHRILSNNNTLHLFMIHLSKEYSMECLLSYIEMTQYHEYIVKDDDESVPVTAAKYGNEKEHNLQLPSEIPLSAIVSAKEENVDFETIVKLKGHKLYKKYIEEGSEFEINISWEQRERADHIFKDNQLLLGNNSIQLQDIIELFGDLRSEMFCLLSFSYDRFKYHPDYVKVRALFGDNTV